MITLTREEALEVLYALEDAVSCGDFIETYKNIKAKIMQSEKKWVGLTKTEFNEATNNLEDLEDCWIAIEAKLKEKNNG